MAQTLAELLYGFRSAARLSQEALAERAGVSARTVSDIETGAARTPRLVTLMLLAEAMGLSEPEHARLKEAGRRAPVVAGATDVPQALRAPVLVGRERNVAALAAFLEKSEVRLITLCGPAGVGKTSLALRVAADRAALYSDGAALVELAAILDPALVPGAVARALGVRESGGPDAARAVIDALATRNVLVVLDTLEHLTPAAVWIAQLLAGCPRLSLIATSREALHVRAEVVYAVKPLGPLDAAELFTLRAQAVQPDFSLDGGNGAAVATIVQRLEGLPLAIELAAPRLRLLPARALAARLDRRLPLLEEGTVDLPSRQQTMRGAIAWSYDLLAPDEQAAFRALAVLNGGGSIDAARAIVDSDPEKARTSILLRLAALVDKSLLRVEEDAEGEPRVTMLEMLREFGHERLAQSDKLMSTRARHAAYFLELARSAETELVGNEQALWFGRLEREHTNVRAALQWAAERGDARFGLELASRIWRMWWQRGYLTEGQAWLQRFIDLAPDAADPVDDRLLAKSLRALVVLMSALGNFNEALAPCEKAVALQRAAGDEGALCASLTSLGIIMQFRGDLAAAKTLHEEGLAIRRRIGDTLGAATSLSNLSSVAFTAGELEESERFARECMAQYQRVGNTAGVGHALMKLGLVAAQQGSYDAAERYFDEVRTLQRELGNTAQVCYALSNLAMVAQKRGDHRLALERYRAAIELFGTVPNRAAIAGTLEGLAATLLSTGEAGRAARLFGAAETLRLAIGSPRFPAEHAEYLENVEAAKRALGEAAFDAEWQLGTALTVERAFAEARADEVSA